MCGQNRDGTGLPVRPSQTRAGPDAAWTSLLAALGILVCTLAASGGCILMGVEVLDESWESSPWRPDNGTAVFGLEVPFPIPASRKGKPVWGDGVAMLAGNDSLRFFELGGGIEYEPGAKYGGWRNMKQLWSSHHAFGFGASAIIVETDDPDDGPRTRDATLGAYFYYRLMYNADNGDCGVSFRYVLPFSTVLEGQTPGGLQILMWTGAYM